MDDLLEDELIGSLAARRGHFRLESGHHGDLWLDLDLLYSRPRRLARFATALAERLAPHWIEVVCGPMVGGAFVGQLVAAELNVEFSYAERFAPAPSDELFAVEYRIPSVLRTTLTGRRVAVVDDVINAGSATRATFADLLACNARPVAIGALLVLGPAADRFAAGNGVPSERLAALENNLWEPAACPLCASGTPLEDPGSA